MKPAIPGRSALKQALQMCGRQVGASLSLRNYTSAVVMQDVLDANSACGPGHSQLPVAVF